LYASLERCGFISLQVQRAKVWQDNELRTTAMNAQTTERRAAPRHRVLKHGMLAFGGGGGVDCTVRNISANGARVDIVSPIGLPQAFTLVIETDRFLRRCHAVWSDAQRVGVVFD
jgi:hypothetical protein